MTRPPSIKDVARLAGVSTATVSRTLNNLSTVAPETRDVVLAAATEVGYQCNHIARNLRRQESGAIAVLIPNLGNPFFSDILAGIEAVMTQSSINVLVLDTTGESTQHADIAGYLTSQRADGIICLDGRVEPDFLSRGNSKRDLPMVFACEWPVAGGCSSVCSDNAKGARLAVDHLVDLGHTRIGHVAGPVANVLTAERKQATINALVSHNLEVCPDWFFSGDFSLESGVSAAKQWLALEGQPSAVFCASDLMAIGMIAEFNRHNISVPDDVSIVGFDDIDIARYYSPTLTTIRQPTRQLGVAAASELLDSLNGVSTDTVLKLLDVELVARLSTSRLLR